ncbi:MAG: sugar ABC transporter substrate-binding protein [Chloroflexi bacterium]|nr:sugar ABC transporter substrate-binding protein [Chloroflexota bacterium]
MMRQKSLVFFVVLIALIGSLSVGLVAAQNVEITFAAWAGAAEEAAFRSIVERYQAANPGVTVNLELLPAANAVELLDVRLAAGEAPDVVRGGFRGDIVHYAQSSGLIELSPYLEEGFTEDFLPAAMELMTYQGGIYGLPLNTDTFGVFYNKAYFEAAGITPPASMDECWTYDEFVDVAAQIRDASDAEYGFSHLATNGKRWMALLYENGGQLLSDDLSAPMITEPAGLETIAWTQRWYTEGLVAAGNTMRGQEVPENLFVNGLAGMLIHGNYIMPFLAANMDEGSWGVTYMPCGSGQGADFGGTGLAVTKDSANPEIAADFVKFATNPESMAEFAAISLFLPTRQSVIDAGVEWSDLPEEMDFFAGELLSEINPHMARIMALPNFPAINRTIADQMELAWTSGQSVEDTAQAIAEGLTEALADS